MTITLKRNQSDLVVPAERNLLRNRHRLSHQQIDRLLEEQSGSAYLSEKLQQLGRVRVFLQIISLLQGQGIGIVALKGIPLSQRIYKDPTVRFSHDIDLLVTSEHANEAVSLLREQGYEFSEGVFWPDQEKRQQILMTQAHHLSLINKTDGTCIEIHWTLMHGLPVSHLKLQKAIASNVEQITLGGKTFSVLKPEFELLFLLIHGSRHAWSRLKWLIDIAEYPQEIVNEEAFLDLVNQFSAHRIVAQANILCSAIFKGFYPLKNNETTCPRRMIDYPRYAMIHPEVNDFSISGIVLLYRYQWFAFPGYNLKWKILWSFFIRQGDIAETETSSVFVLLLYRPYSFVRRRILHAK